MKKTIKKLTQIHCLLNKTYKKVVHINGNSASLSFYIKTKGEWVPWTTTRYFNFDVFSFNKLPNFIKRHVNEDILQDYVNSKAMEDFSRYPFGLFFEEKELNYKLTFGKCQK